MVTTITHCTTNRSADMPLLRSVTLSSRVEESVDSAWDHVAATIKTAQTLYHKVEVSSSTYLVGENKIIGKTSVQIETIDGSRFVDTIWIIYRTEDYYLRPIVGL